MAGEATHIILADRTLSSHALPYHRREFLLGTVFPDIRYLGDIERDSTHAHEVSLDAVLSEADSFVAGAKFHSLVDKTRNDYIKAAGLYDLCPPFLYDQQALKFLEDALFYPRYEWKEALQYFDKTPALPPAFHVAEDVLERWYALIRDYISVEPSDASRVNLLIAEGYTSEAVILMNAYIEELKNNKAATGIMLEFFKEFSLLI